MPAKHLIGLLLLLPVIGCNASEPASETLPAVAAPAEKQAANSAQTPRNAVDQPPTPAQDPAAPAVITPPISAPSPAPATSDSQSTKAGKPPEKTATKPETTPAPEPPPQKTPDTAPTATTPQGPPPMALAALEQRLKDTDAIGVFTKIALKNQVDDLLKQFQTQYESGSKADLGPLRKNYDQLLAKVHGLLKDGDPALAGVIMTSREAIWNALTDPVKFAKL